MFQRRRNAIHIAVCALISLVPGVSAADSVANSGNNPVSAGLEMRCTAHNPASLIAAIRPVSGDQITISQLRREIVPLNDVLAELKPQRCGSLVGVRLMQLRSVKVYRLRILKDTGGVVDLYVNARTGTPL